VGLSENEKIQLEKEIRERAADIYSNERKLWQSLSEDSAKISIFTKSGAVFSNKGQNWKQL
jgi:hypothetical protein